MSYFLLLFLGFHVLQVLSWKTLIVKRRHYLETILDIFVPTILFIILVVLRFEFDGLAPTQEKAQTFPNNDMFRNIDYDFRLCPIPQYGEGNSVFLYTPLTLAANDTINQWDMTLQSFYTELCNAPDLTAYKVGKSFYLTNNCHLTHDQEIMTMCFII